jgi:hypothetical protein
MQPRFPRTQSKSNITLQCSASHVALPLVYHSVLGCKAATVPLYQLKAGPDARVLRHPIPANLAMVMMRRYWCLNTFPRCEEGPGFFRTMCAGGKRPSAYHAERLFVHRSAYASTIVHESCCMFVSVSRTGKRKKFRAYLVSVSGFVS